MLKKMECDGLWIVLSSMYMYGMVITLGIHVYYTTRCITIPLYKIYHHLMPIT